MAFAPISLTIPQYEDFPNQFLKAFIQGTTTPLAMATDATGGTTASKFELDTQGFPKTAGGARLIPFIDGDYDLWLFPTAAEADANDTTNAIQFADDLNADALNASALGGATVVTEAPVDGEQYVRKDAAWSILDPNFTIDSAQTGVLVKNTYWAVAATVARTRALPASPADGDEITIFIASGDPRPNNVTIGRNGNTIDDIAADKVLTIDAIQTLKFDLAATNWVSVLDTNRTLDGRIQDWKEVVHTMTTVAVDATNGTWQMRTLAGNETFTFNLFSGQSVYVTVVPGANTLTLTNVTEWVGGAAPSTIEAEHAFVFWSDDGIAVTGLSVGGIS